MEIGSHNSVAFNALRQKVLNDVTYGFAAGCEARAPLKPQTYLKHLGYALSATSCPMKSAGLSPNEGQSPS